MEVRPHIIVHLGYGRYVRSDKIVALDPIDDKSERGPGRRTRVYVEGQPTPLIGSRTEGAILREMVEVPKEILEARRAVDLLEDLLEDLADVGPMLRRSIREEANLDLDAMERRIRTVLDIEE